MEGKPVDDYDAEEVLDVVESLHAARVAGECQVLELAVQFAVLHNGDTLHAGRRLPGRQRPVRLGGAGTPTVAEFAPAELGARMQLGPFAAKMLLADALDTRFRLPETWARVQAGTARVPLVRALAQATRHLSQQAAAKVDAAVADLVDGRLPRARFDRVLAAQIVAADPQTAAAREDAAAHDSFARASRSTEHGMKSFTLRAAAPLVIRFDATVAYLADALAALGDADDEASRRIKACLIMANPTHAVQLLAAFAAHRATNPPENQQGDEPDGAGGAEPEPGLLRPTPFRPGDPVPSLARLACSGGYRFTPEKLLPRVTVYVHLWHQQMVRDHGGVARFEGGDPITHDFVRRYLAPHHEFTITGVLDLDQMAPVDGYEIPAMHRTAVKILSPADTFPFATGLATDPDTHIDVDHTAPYRPPDQGGPPGQSRIGNYSPLGRFHHRIKTFGAWSLRQPFPGIWVWRDPHGHYYLVDHTGTRKTRPRAGSSPGQQQSAEPRAPAAPGPPDIRGHDPDLEAQFWSLSERLLLEYAPTHIA